MEYTYAIWKLYHFWFERYGQEVFVHTSHSDAAMDYDRDADSRTMTLAPQTYLSQLTTN